MWQDTITILWQLYSHIVGYTMLLCMFTFKERIEVAWIWWGGEGWKTIGHARLPQNVGAESESIQK